MGFKDRSDSFCLRKEDNGKRICRVCGKEFMARTRVHMYCSKECNIKAQKEKRLKGKNMEEQIIVPIMDITNDVKLVYWKDKYYPFVIAWGFNPDAEPGNMWDSGNYFFTLEGALKHIKDQFGKDVYADYENEDVED